jgi:NADH dehydrogenase FAD-containing subunit
MKRTTNEKRHVVILGGGFAGLSAAQNLSSERFHVTLIDQRGQFEFLPNIHELLSDVKTPELLRLPLDRIVERAGHDFVRDRVTGIDPANHEITTKRRRRPIAYDALIVALGGVDATRGVPGVVEHAMPFKSARDCERIGKRLARLAVRRTPGRVVIVGGGLEGVEALGEILRRHRDSELQVTVVEGRERLLADSPAALDEHIRKICAPYRVAFEVASFVRSIESKAVELKSGPTLPSDLTIWTGGPAPPGLFADAGLAPPGAWAPVDHTLQSKFHPEVFVAGDGADFPKPLAKQAYHAIDMGVRAARNVERMLGGNSLTPFEPSDKPTLISFGDLTCFLIAGKLVLAGPAISAAKEAVFELVMTQLDGRPLASRLPNALHRAETAARQLAWPTLTSFEALRRQGCLSVLASD